MLLVCCSIQEGVFQLSEHSKRARKRVTMEKEYLSSEQLQGFENYKVNIHVIPINYWLTVIIIYFNTVDLKSSFHLTIMDVHANDGLLGRIILMYILFTSFVQ